MSQPRPSRWLPAAILIASASCTIAFFSSRHLERLWDEQVDHDIAIGLRDHPVTGARPAIDASQMRLPMYVNAIVFKLTGSDDLQTSRVVSLVVAGVTIVARLSGEGHRP